MLSRRHSKPSAGLVVGLALALSFAGITETGPSSQAIASSAACPAGWTFKERASGVNDIPWPAYCERTVTHLATTQQIQLSNFGTELQLIAYGGVGGSGGNDNGFIGGSSGPVGMVSGTLSVTPGETISISTGGAGGNGTLGGENPVPGGGAGLSASARSGAAGGPMGCFYPSPCNFNRSKAGTGGGGGGATVVAIGGVDYIAAGAGGGGGANWPGPGNGQPGVTNSFTTNVSGTIGADGGGNDAAGGGGGGGLLGGNGGARGIGGSAGSNFAGSHLTGSYIQPASIQRAAGDTSRNGFVVMRQTAMPVVSQITEISNRTLSSATQFTYEVRFSEPVTGFGIEDVTLSGTAGADNGWALEIEPVSGGQVYRVIASHDDAPSGTIELTALATGIQAGDRTGVGQLSSPAINIERTPPTVSSMSIIPDLTNANRVRITLQFSEAISAIDADLIELGEPGSNWTRSNPTISGSSYSFDATYTTLIAEDIKVAVGVGAATDLAGNLNTAAREFTQLVDLTTPTASFSASTYRLNSSSTTQNLTLNFDRPVWGLTASDLTFSSLCTVGVVSPATGPETTYTVPITCSTAGSTTLTLTTNSVKDFASTAGPAAPVSVTVIRDTTAPTISSVVGRQVANAIEYSVTFSEEISTFPASAITTSGSPATGTWTYSTPVRVGNTNEWSFTAVNPSPVNGNHVPVFNSTNSIRDLAGNALMANPSFSGLALQFLPTYTVGTLSQLGADAVALAPNFDLDLKGGKIHSIRLTNDSWASSGSTKDVFSNLPGSGMGSPLNTSSSNGVIEITAPNATEAQWEAAIRAIRFDAGSSSGTRSFTYHIKPVSGYDYASGAMFEGITQSTALGHAAAKTLAASVNRYGYQGYLATPNSASQAEAAKNASLVGNNGLFLWLDLKRPTGTTVVSDSGLPRDVAAGEANFTNWDSAYPGYPQPELGVGENFVFANKANGKWHDAFATDNNALGYVVEFGLRGTEDFPALLSRTVSAEVDTSVPEVLSVSTLTTAGTYVLGEKIRIAVEMSEPTVVTGIPTMRMNTNSNPIRYANYVSGSGTDTLIFEYTIDSQDYSADLNYFDTSSLGSAGTMKDLGGNNAIRTLPPVGSAESLAGSSAIVVDANLFIPAAFSLGALPAIGPNVINLLPNFDLSVRGTSPVGIRITNKNFDAAASTPDAFSIGSLPAGVTLVTNSAGVFELYSETLNEAGWENLIRQIAFDAGSSGNTPAFDVHVRPLKAYDYSTGHAYKYVAQTGLTHNQLKQLAESSSLAGFAGYLANPTSSAETSLMLQVLPQIGSQPAGYAAAIGLVKQAATATAAGTDPVKVISPAAEAGNISYVNWNSGEPNTTTDLCTQMHPTGKWNDYSCDSLAYNQYLTGYIVEYGGVTPETNFLSLMSRTATYSFDLEPPVVQTVFALPSSGTLLAGDEAEIRVRFNEPITVTGTPTLSLPMGSNTRLANCEASSTPNELVCRYTIAQGDVSSDLSYLNTTSLSLNGGTIRDSAGNDAVLTLPALNSPQSLGGSSSVAVDGNRNTLTLSASSPTSSSQALTFTLNATLPIDCSTISTQPGVDFVFTGISSIGPIVSSNGGRTCTISATSSVTAGQYGISSLSRASTFSVDSLQSPPVETTAVVIQNNQVEVEIPALAGQGAVTRNPIPGDRRDVIDRVAPSLVMGASPAPARSVLVQNGVVAAPEGVPGVEFEGDFTLATSRVEARKREQILAGDQVIVSLTVDPSVAATHEVAAFFKSTIDSDGSGWTFLGRKDFEQAGLVSSEPMVFTKIGTYYLRLIVVAKGAQFREASAAPATFSAFSFSMPPIPRAAPNIPGNFAALGTLKDEDLPIGVQSLEVAVEVVGTEPTLVTPGDPAVIEPTPANPPTSPSPKPINSPTQTPTPSPTPTPTPSATEEPSAEPEPTESSVAEAPAAETEATSEPAPEAQSVLDSIGDVIASVFGAVANPGIGASGDDSVIVEFDPLGSPEAVKATNNLLAATGALIGVAAAAGAAAAAAAAAGAAAGAASAAGSAASAAGSAPAGAEMNEDVLDALAGAEYDMDVFEDSKERWGDRLAMFALPLLTFLDRPTRLWTRRVAKFSPFVSKLLNDGIYLRAIAGSMSMLPTIAAIVIAIISLQLNQGELLHPPVPLFIALAVLGIFDGLAGAVGLLVFLVGSLPLVDFTQITDLRMLAGILVAGFGPIVLARSVRNFRRKAPVGTQGLLDRIGDIAFASLLGGWVAGLVVRALPALTGLTLPAANYVLTFQIVATIAIAIRILIEDFAARYYPARMDQLAPDYIPEPPKAQVIVSHIFKYFFYAFVASAFMGFGPVVWIASALFMLPGLLGYVADRFPRIPVLWKLLPTGLPGLAMILGLEIVLEGWLSQQLGDDPNFSTIFVFALLGLITLLTILGILGRPKPGEIHPLAKPQSIWLYRAGGVFTLFALIYLTSQL